MSRSLRDRVAIASLTIVTVLFGLVGATARAADDEPTCRFLLQRIGIATQQASLASDEERERAKYLQRIALMERNALQSANASSAAVFDSELARANQSFDAARTRSQLAGLAVNVATTAYVEQCPEHFAAIHGDYLQLAILVAKTMSDSNQTSAK